MNTQVTLMFSCFVVIVTFVKGREVATKQSTAERMVLKILPAPMHPAPCPIRRDVGQGIYGTYAYAPGVGLRMVSD